MQQCGGPKAHLLVGNELILIIFEGVQGDKVDKVVENGEDGKGEQRGKLWIPRSNTPAKICTNRSRNRVWHLNRDTLGF